MDVVLEHNNIFDYTKFFSPKEFETAIQPFLLGAEKYGCFPGLCDYKGAMLARLDCINGLRISFYTVDDLVDHSYFNIPDEYLSEKVWYWKHFHIIDLGFNHYHLTRKTIGEDYIDEL